MWGAFAQGTGARIQIRIVPKAAELRAIQYEDHSKRTLLNEINGALSKAGEPVFVPQTLSKIGAFYLPCTVQSEDEVRLLIKRYQGGPNPVASDGQFDYWPIAIGKDNDFCRVDVTGIHVAPSGKRCAVEAAIAGTALEAGAITGP
jgi:hypothetical protein